MLDLEKFQEHLLWAEGERLDLYKDSEGIYTIGVGHNIQDKGISRDVSRAMLKEDIDDVIADCESLSIFDTLDPVRQLVVADMVFNLGLSRFLRFKKFNAAMLLKDWKLAAHEMKDSKWYGQVGRRAEKLVEAMRTGVWNA